MRLQPRLVGQEGGLKSRVYLIVHTVCIDRLLRSRLGSAVILRDRRYRAATKGSG